jgi:AcrR family transcriptional regulator
VSRQSERVLDPRAQRTRQALRGAVISLIGSGDIQSISISDVVREAGVNRSSFYVHYSDLDELLADAFEELSTEVNQTNMISPGVPHDAETGLPKTLLQYLDHIARYKQAYAWALGPKGSAAVTSRLRNQFREIIQQSLLQYADRRNAVPIGFDADAAYLAGAVIGTISIWLTEAPQVPAKRVSVWLWRQLQQDFLRILERYALTNRPAPRLPRRGRRPQQRPHRQL